jgi:uridylate kinase
MIGAQERNMVQVISLGGSIISPGDVDTGFLRSLRNVVVEHITDSANKLIFVTGGGAPARRYQEAYRDVVTDADDTSLDWIGVAATRLNAELIRGVFSERCKDPVVTDPTADCRFSGDVLVAAGWKPGFSTDYDAVLLAERFGARSVINLSNVAKVYTADPRKHPEAEALEHVSWAEFRGIVGDTWTPGSNLPFDPVASQKAERAGLQVIFAAGRDVDNLRHLLAGSPFEGTTIGPE